MKTTSLLVALSLAGLGLAQTGGGPRPAVEFLLKPGEGAATPSRKGLSYVNGGTIDVAQPDPTTIVVTMSGLTATNADLVCTSAAYYHFELTQGFEVVFNSKRVQSAKLLLEGRVIGLLRSSHNLRAGCLQLSKKSPVAETEAAHAGVSCAAGEVVGVTLPARSVTACDSLSVYNRETACHTQVLPGCYTLHESWGFGTTHPCFTCRGASAEFSPQPYYAPESYWFQEFRPFNGLASKDFGYQVTLRLVPEFKPEPEEKDEDEKKPDGKKPDGKKPEDKKPLPKK